MMQELQMESFCGKKTQGAGMKDRGLNLVPEYDERDLDELLQAVIDAACSSASRGEIVAAAVRASQDIRTRIKQAPMLHPISTREAHMTQAELIAQTKDFLREVESAVDPQQDLWRASNAKGAMQLMYVLADRIYNMRSEPKERKPNGHPGRPRKEQQ